MIIRFRDCHNLVIIVQRSLIFCKKRSLIMIRKPAKNSYLSCSENNSVYFTFGEDGQNFSFPLISICNYFFVKENTYFQSCLNKTNGRFISSLKECISKDQKKFSSVEFYDSLGEKIPIIDISIEFEGKSHSIPSNYVWEYSYHEKYGYCHVLDIHKFEEFPNLN